MIGSLLEDESLRYKSATHAIVNLFENIIKFEEADYIICRIKTLDLTFL